MEKKDVLAHHAKLFEPTPSELHILRADEPHIIFSVLPPDGISQGRQSRVSILEYRERGTPQQVLFKRMGAGKGLPFNVARHLESRLESYRRELVRFGWNIPHTYYTKTLQQGNEGQIFSYEQRIGRADGEKIFTNPEQPNFLRWSIVRQTFAQLAHYPRGALHRKTISGREVTALPHGLDLKLANVVPDTDGTLYFVDLFCPKEIGPAGSWLTYRSELDSLPEENLMAVCATREGAMLRFWRLAEMLWTQTVPTTPEQLREGFFALLDSLSLPQEEINFMQREVSSGYPWLDEIYSEAKV